MASKEGLPPLFFFPLPRDYNKCRMAKRKKSEAPTGDSCAELVPRLEKLEKAFKELTGVTVEEYEGNPGSDPVVETKEFDSSIIKIHQSGAKEFLRKCPWCNTPVADLATHKAKCPQRPIF